MSLPHARPLEPIEPLETPGADNRSLIKTSRLQLLRLALGPDKPLPDHRVDSDCVIHCLEGCAEVITTSGRQSLAAGQLLVMPGGERHSIAATVSTILLVTLLLENGDAGDGGGRGAVSTKSADPSTDATTPSRFQA